MPYSRKAKYRHYRQKEPSEFIRDSYRTIPIEEAIDYGMYKGKKFKKKGNKALVGFHKKSDKYKIQSILELKRK